MYRHVIMCYQNCGPWWIEIPCSVCAVDLGVDRAVIVTQAEDSAMALDQSIKSEKMLKGFKKFSDITNSSQKRCFGYSNSTNPYLLKPPQRLKTVRHKPIDVKHDESWPPPISCVRQDRRERVCAAPPWSVKHLGLKLPWSFSHVFSLFSYLTI